MAARLRKDLALDVALVAGDYGEFTVLVDDQPAIEGGALTALAILPRYDRILAAVRERLAR